MAKSAGYSEQWDDLGRGSDDGGGLDYAPAGALPMMPGEGPAPELEMSALGETQGTKLENGRSEPGRYV